MDFKDVSRKDQLQEVTNWLPCSNIISNNWIFNCARVPCNFYAGCKKLNQTYTFVTMDLVAAKIAFNIKFGDAERFSPVIIHIRFSIYIPVYAVGTTICNHSNAHKYSFVSIVLAAFDIWPQSKWLLRWHHSYIHDNTTLGYLNTAIGNFFLQISIIDNHDCYY